MINVEDGLSRQIVCTISVHPNWKAKELKEAVAEATGIHRSNQRLIWGGRALRKQDGLNDIVASSQRRVKLVRVEFHWHSHLDGLDSTGLLLTTDLDFKTDEKSQQEIAELIQDRNFVLAAVLENGGALFHASQEIKDDREVVLTAVRDNGLALAFASSALRGDREVVLTALEQNGAALEYASDELRASREIALVAVQECGEAFRFVVKALQFDREIALAAVRSSASVMSLLPMFMKEQRDFVLACVQANGDALDFVTPEMRRDGDIVNVASMYWAELSGKVDLATSPRRAVPILKDNARRNAKDYHGNMQRGGALGIRAYP